MLPSFLSGEFLLNIPYWIYLSVGSFSYTSHAAFFLKIWGVSLTHPMMDSFLSGEFLLHIPCWFNFYVGSFFYTSQAGFFSFFSFLNLGSFSYTSRAAFIFIRRVSVTHPVLASFLSGGFLLHITRWLHFYLGSFSYTSRAVFIFIWGVSLTHPVLPSLLSGFFFLLRFFPFFFFF